MVNLTLFIAHENDSLDSDLERAELQQIDKII